MIYAFCLEPNFATFFCNVERRGRLFYLKEFEAERRKGMMWAPWFVVDLRGRPLLGVYDCYYIWCEEGDVKGLDVLRRFEEVWGVHLSGLDGVLFLYEECRDFSVVYESGGDYLSEAVERIINRFCFKHYWFTYLDVFRITKISDIYDTDLLSLSVVRREPYYLREFDRFAIGRWEGWGYDFVKVMLKDISRRLFGESICVMKPLVYGHLYHYKFSVPFERRTGWGDVVFYLKFKRLGGLIFLWYDVSTFYVYGLNAFISYGCEDEFLERTYEVMRELFERVTPLVEKGCRVLNLKWEGWERFKEGVLRFLREKKYRLEFSTTL